MTVVILKPMTKTSTTKTAATTRKIKEPGSQSDDQHNSDSDSAVGEASFVQNMQHRHAAGVILASLVDSCPAPHFAVRYLI